MHQPTHHTPQPPRPPRLTERRGFRYGCLPALIITWVLIVISIFTGGDDEPDAKPDAKAPAASSPARKADDAKAEPSGGLSKREITKLSVDMVWGNYTEAERDVACLGIDAYGKEWYADQMKSENIDPDYAAELLESKCANR